MLGHSMCGSRWMHVASGLLVAVATSLLLSTIAPAAFATEAPAWRITSYPAPTHLLPPTDEVQTITIKSTGAGGTISGQVPGYGGFFTFSPTANASEVQEVLEAQVGPGNVQVAGGPGDAEGTKPYVVKFTGALAGEAVETMSISGSGFPNEASEGVTVEESHKGGSGGELVVTAVNVGGDATDGSSISIRDALPPGLVATTISGEDSYEAGTNLASPPSALLACSTPPTLVCTQPAAVEPGDQLVVTIGVRALAGAPANVINQASVTGGGAPGNSVSSSVAVSATPVGFGLAPGSVLAAVSSSQAGAHADVTAGFALNTTGLASFGARTSAADPKDVSFDLPPGLVGNTVGLPRCTAEHVIEATCPVSTIVGIASTQHLFLNEPSTDVNPIYDIAPSPGEPAAFMFQVAGQAPVRLDTSVLSNGDYGVRVTGGDLSQAEPLLANYVTIWGVPADHEGSGPIHVTGVVSQGRVTELGGPDVSATRVPLLSNPTQCSTPLTAVAEADAWRHPGVFDKASVSMGSLSGCDLLSFGGSMSMLPDTLLAGVPAGYSLDLKVPQDNAPNGLAQSLVKKVVTTLPMGTVISPSAALGLGVCSDAQFFGPDRGVESPSAPGACPRESQVGTVQITTPALPLPLTGDVYLATPHCGPCTPEDARDGQMVRLFVQVVGEGESGIVVKLEGTASIDQQTGQITATFDNNPQLPFSDFKLTLGGGSRATLANPRSCGSVTTTIGLTPWSTPFTPEVSPFYTFDIDEGCITPQFNPSFVAGTTSIQAGAYSPFTVSFGRSDADEFLNGLQMQLPPGLLGSLSNVPLCHEPQAAQGTCGTGSLIGHTQVLTGPGQTPFLVTGGQVFLTEGYKGAPFGLSIVVPAVAGPYTLAGTAGSGTVVVRAAINVDPSTAALTITSDALPTALDGIPLQLKVVNVTIDRPGFTLNPTSCAKTAIVGTLSSKEGASEAVSSPFQATNCAGLSFKPQFLVSTSGKTSHASGASLDAKVVYPVGMQGTQANIAKVKVDLPKQLPSRLTTLQKACLAATFEANPSACPAGSVVGIARANTPILPVPLTGPVYFVSHGGEAFPSLIVVLQGYGVRVDLVGSTFISKQGITSSTFKQVPDVPISSFELYLPEGPHSALAANGSLCSATKSITVRKRVTTRSHGHLKRVTKSVKESVRASLLMPTSFVAQNGSEIHEETKITVTGCPTARKVTKAEKKPEAKRASKVSNGHGERSKQS
jgi:hypothetical protein